MVLQVISVTCLELNFQVCVVFGFFYSRTTFMPRHLLTSCLYHLVLRLTLVYVRWTDISEITGLDIWGHLLSSVPGAIFPAPPFLSCGLHCLRGHLPVAESTEQSGEGGDVESSGWIVFSETLKKWTRTNMCTCVIWFLSLMHQTYFGDWV